MGGLRKPRAPSLFPIPPIGVGTAAVESLTSYVVRLSVAHGVTVGQLLRFLYETRPADMGEPAPGSGPGGDHIGRLPELVRPSRASRFIRQRLEAVTGSQDLVRLTFAPLAGGLDRCQNTFAAHTRWCPACLRESEIAGVPAYYKLIWQVRDVKLCPVHDVVLLDRCTACDAYQDTRGRRQPLNMCQSCSASLAQGAEKEPLSEWAQSQSADISELLDEYLELPAEGFSADFIRSGLDRFFDRYWESEREQELYHLFGGRDRWLAVVCGSSPMTLQTLRRTAYRLGVSLYDLMCGELAQQTLGLEESPQIAKPAFMRVRRSERYDREAVLQRVRETLEAMDTPLPLVAVARHAGVSTGYLRYRFPALTLQIVEAHERFEAERKQRQRQEAVQAILEYRTRVERGSGAVGVKKMVNSLHRSHGFSKYMLRRAWDDVQNR